MPRTFAIGDIHGCCKTFTRLLLEELAIQKDDTIYCVGDYVDRGPDSKGVVDLILKLRADGYTIYTLRGNHEELMLSSANSNRDFLRWMDKGGEATLDSFGVYSFIEMDEVYQQFFQQTEFYRENGNFIYVHAGLNFHEEN